ncbi:THUMP domain-containing class I SAM-dependent RNA methyltransferase [Tropicibacter oceani]|uniref:Class I SAM-dependent RNA methyltransferase n=1 Tax=Tropicibacter oceani TaxID=3058420 RepID=A0ABY8QLN7_9RHOB|nr:class I SAM-dependent RNA methyltransferase [Tropicibacter oceani]WGW05527.1 class I SAM-dependent RNA methyltransferase [Tropicibacter oceani]
MEPFEIFLAGTPGLEPVLRDEAAAIGLPDPKVVPGGVVTRGTWPDVWRANLHLRGANRVLARIGEFRAFHLAQLDKRSRKFDWAAHLRPDLAVRVEVTCKASKIYHDRAARQRIETAITDSLGAPIAEDAPIRLMARIEDDLVSFSLDTSGEPLHRRGHKEAVNKAPLRETLAALFLRECGYDGTQPVIDPMCGSGTFVIEAAEIALGLAPGRTRAFAFEQFASFDAAAWQAMKADVTPRQTDLVFRGFDRDDGAIRFSQANAQRAGVAEVTTFARQAISDLKRPEGPPGLIMVNPPYGARIGNRNLLFALYGALGQVLKSNFRGWRLGMVTSDPGLAKSTGLSFVRTSAPIPHGGLGIKLYQTGPLP